LDLLFPEGKISDELDVEVLFNHCHNIYDDYSNDFIS